MLQQKIQGCSEGYYVTIGTTIFAMKHTWGDAAEEQANFTQLKKQTKLDSPQPKNFPYGGIPIQLIAYAYKEKGTEWVASENPLFTGQRVRCQVIGRLLANVPVDKKERIPYRQFRQQLADVYTNALRDEANNMFI